MKKEPRLDPSVKAGTLVYFRCQPDGSTCDCDLVTRLNKTDCTVTIVPQKGKR